MADKIYLTKELIDQIQEKAKDPIWKMGILAGFTKNWQDILAVSSFDLIHFLGNSDTGWKHISERHDFYSDTNYFGYGKIGNPSKFTKSSIPIYDYVNVADDIYLSGYRDTSDHKKGEIFDKYIGKSNRYTGSDGTIKDFCLILYKGTKIVHSLYPERNLDNDYPNRILKDFSRCRNKITASQNLNNESVTISIPYENKHKVIRYVIIIRLSTNSMMCKIHIQVNNNKGVPIFTLLPELFTFKVNLTLSTPVLITDIEFTRFINGLDHTDFSFVEERILQIEDYIKKKL